MLTKKEVCDIVSVFYQPKFKAYYINESKRGTSIRPIGVFVSLGITTTLATLNYVKDSILALGNYQVFLCEVKSREVNGRYLNSIVQLEDRFISQYRIEDTPMSVLERDQALIELKYCKATNPRQAEVLSKLIEKIDENNGWERHAIQRNVGADYTLYHKFVNYRRDGASDYRIGLFITEK